MRKWYAIFVQGAKEEDVMRRILERFDRSSVYCCVPKRKVPEKKDGVVNAVIKPMFPGYVFLQIHMDFKTYYEIQAIPEVIKVLNYENKKDKQVSQEQGHEEMYFKSIPDEEMEHLIKLMDDKAIVDYSTVLLNNNVITIVSGPLKGMEGSIKKIDKHKKRAKLLLNFLGCEKLIDLGIELLAPTPTSPIR
ncbi:antiterminator LoaP [Paenibacillus sp. FJAT-26967]|uniref:antiterminator LoaP n=1 Tax=Paenibacillus sp. FJAT-26967 TaxID=1729690 RepID=UPI000838E0A7|nr:antiterminator LoaP [Paenibacillus sp. FJAT-26967]